MVSIRQIPLTVSLLATWEIWDIKAKQNCLNFVDELEKSHRLFHPSYIQRDIGTLQDTGQDMKYVFSQRRYDYHTSCLYACWLFPLLLFRLQALWGYDSCLTHSWITSVPKGSELTLLMLNCVELRLTKSKLIKSMLTKCVHPRERNMLFALHFLPTLF